ncbi:hypothetical protein J6590_100582, partial [Homalodisca vitripennis]
SDAIAAQRNKTYQLLSISCPSISQSAKFGDIMQLIPTKLQFTFLFEQRLESDDVMDLNP